MKLLLDEHFSARIAEQLRSRGHDVVAVVEVPELVGRSDVELFEEADRRGCAIVTENVKDFLLLVRELAPGGRPHAGLILTSHARFPRNAAAIGALVGALDALLSQTPDLSAGAVHWLQRAETSEP